MDLSVFCRIHCHADRLFAAIWIASVSAKAILLCVVLGCCNSRTISLCFWQNLATVFPEILSLLRPWGVVCNCHFQTVPPCLVLSWNYFFARTIEIINRKAQNELENNIIIDRKLNCFSFHYFSLPDFGCILLQITVFSSF